MKFAISYRNCPGKTYLGVLLLISWPALAFAHGFKGSAHFSQATWYFLFFLFLLLPSVLMLLLSKKGKPRPYFLVLPVVLLGLFALLTFDSLVRDYEIKQYKEEQESQRTAKTIPPKK